MDGSTRESVLAEEQALAKATSGWESSVRASPSDPPVAPSPRSGLRLQILSYVTRFLRAWMALSPAGKVGSVIAAAWVLLAIFAPILAPSDALRQSPALLQAPSPAHWMGTDELGRDVLSRVIFGARISIPYSALVVVISVAFGSAVGGVGAYFGGWVDGVIMRVADLVFAFPSVVLVMAVAAALGPGLAHAVVAIALVTWPSYARITRSLVMTAIHSDYVASARLLGASSIEALFRDIAPNVAAPIIVIATLGMGRALLLLASLSFLGLGSQPPTPEWGLMITDGITYFSSPWMSIFPGLAILSAAMAFNLIGDSVGDAFSLRLSQRP